eukprot:CAMPEP_0175996950 /NCGR_PEP_ID=MMETSP0108-20121206/55940_1 /TAXON_ID=195067 ORGANISM="Goniomonas pacifica, Strain CCMP1869" /NCGR_SAMPLE_ID=MMETSP0108 /ASSEMBLY_ACC=CAM_ASM_000204 /LENGTH=57 /DNA_ID=CAMNT_0017329177 /DNA_START=26 /DNA_END=195 /DNA_ORIENTATION=+
MDEAVLLISFLLLGPSPRGCQVRPFAFAGRAASRTATLTPPTFRPVATTFIVRTVTG